MGIKLDWLHEELQFSGIDSKGNVALVDGNSKTASSPMTLLLHALAGCTGSDVISILEKMRILPEEFSISVDGTRSEVKDQPKPWKKIHLVFSFKGKELNSEKVSHAVVLSMEKFCSVAAMLRHDAEITWEVILN